MVNIDKRYVVGFYFTDTKKVVLITKMKPEWQKGKMNGVGGHIEEGELPIDAMRREFREETGVEEPIDWKLYCYACQDGHDGDLYFYHAFGPEIPVRTTTQEPVGVYGLEELDQLPVHYNLRWLIPMALDADLKTSRVDYK